MKKYGKNVIKYKWYDRLRIWFLNPLYFKMIEEFNSMSFKVSDISLVKDEIQKNHYELIEEFSKVYSDLKEISLKLDAIMAKIKK